MAILTCLPGLEVAIEVDGQRAREYDVDPEEVQKCADKMSFHQTSQTYRLSCHRYPYVLKYIEAKPGKPFSFVLDATNFNVELDDVNFENGVQKEAKIHAEFSMDGYKTKYRKMNVGYANEMSTFKTGNDATGWKRHTFRFARLDVVEKCDGTQAMRAKFYGSLVVKLYLLVDTGRYGPYAEQSVPTPILSVSEKDLKGKAADTKVEFEAEPINRPGPVPKLKWVDPERRPIAVFEFRYRTMEGLHQEYIIPRPVVKSQDKSLIAVEEDYERIKKKYEPNFHDISKDDVASPRGGRRAGGGVKREAPESMPPNPLADARNARKQRRLDQNGKKEVIDLTGDDPENDADDDLLEPLDQEQEASIDELLRSYV